MVDSIKQPRKPEPPKKAKTPQPTVKPSQTKLVTYEKSQAGSKWATLKLSYEDKKKQKERAEQRKKEALHKQQLKAEIKQMENNYQANKPKSQYTRRKKDKIQYQSNEPPITFSKSIISQDEKENAQRINRAGKIDISYNPVYVNERGVLRKYYKVKHTDVYGETEEVLVSGEGLKHLREMQRKNTGKTSVRSMFQRLKWATPEGYTRRHYGNIKGLIETIGNRYHISERLAREFKVAIASLNENQLAEFMEENKGLIDDVFYVYKQENWVTDYDREYESYLVAKMINQIYTKYGTTSKSFKAIEEVDFLDILETYMY